MRNLNLNLFFSLNSISINMVCTILLYDTTLTWCPKLYPWVLYVHEHLPEIYDCVHDIDVFFLKMCYMVWKLIDACMVNAKTLIFKLRDLV